MFCCCYCFMFCVCNLKKKCQTAVMLKFHDNVNSSLTVKILTRDIQRMYRDLTVYIDFLFSLISVHVFHTDLCF